MAEIKNRCPCEDCITFSMCSSSVMTTEKPRFSIFSLENKCKLIKEYLLYDYYFKSKYNEVLKVFKIDKLEEKRRTLNEKSNS